VRDWETASSRSLKRGPPIHHIETHRDTQRDTQRYIPRHTHTETHTERHTMGCLRIEEEAAPPVNPAVPHGDELP